ncbi:hypothetical protein ABEB36_006701 [Hypothenemus hampei]|uniref:Uncharacterized protein n=1 Tax=Hypothenemus hampei TaxID=57062 RepID=A0ABD1ES78_HYPHA
MSPMEEEVCRLKIQLIEKEAEKNLEIMKMKHEIEILNKDKEIERLNKDREFELLKIKHELEKDNIKREITLNWKSIKACEPLQMRTFLDKFKDKNLQNFTGERNEKF